MRGAATSPDSLAAIMFTSGTTGPAKGVLVTQKMLERMERAWNDYQAEIERFCVSRQVPYFVADVETPFDEQVLKVFRRGGFLR